MKNVQFIRGNWVARVVVPEELRPIIGKRELVEELPTEAKARERRALVVLNGFFAQIDEARDKLIASRPTAATAAKAHYLEELDADDRERSVGMGGTGTLPVRQIYARKLRLLLRDRIETDEAEALIGYAADDLVARRLAPMMKRADLLKLLAEVQLEAIARFEERDAGKIVLSTPSLPILNEPDPVLPSVPSVQRTGATLGEVYRPSENLLMLQRRR